MLLVDQRLWSVEAAVVLEFASEIGGGVATCLLPSIREAVVALHQIF